MAEITDLHQRRDAKRALRKGAAGPLDGVEHTPALVLAMAVFGACAPDVQDLAQAIAESVERRTDSPAATAAVAVMADIIDAQAGLRGRPAPRGTPDD